ATLFNDAVGDINGSASSCTTPSGSASPTPSASASKSASPSPSASASASPSKSASPSSSPSSSPTGGTGGNKVTNPGFESGSLSPWTCTGNLGSVVSSPVHSGSHALLGAVSNSDDAQCTQTVSVSPNTHYTLSGWVNGSYVYIGVSGTGSTDVSNWTP